MAPRKTASKKGAGSKLSSTPAKKRVAANGYKLADPVPPGIVMRDIARKEWVLGKSIGKGGFGEIYLASDDPSREVCDTDKYVVKLEPHSNGPLFAEMHCYMRIAKPDLIEAWTKQRKLKRLGMPRYLGSGSFEYKNQKYRFMVMDRFGSDLQKILEQHNKKFSFKTVYQVGIEIIDVLEYIHDKGYIHADIKASNLLIGFQKGTENQVFLVDYGLACRYAIDGVHKEYKYDGRKAHDGTIEFTSRDAHIGAHSRRGDLEILGFNLTQWLCSRLPWEDNLSDCDYVANQKRWYMDNVDKFIDKCFPDVVPPGLQEFLTYVASLTFDEAPDYEKCRNILRKGLIERGYKDDGKLVFMSATPKPTSRKPKSKLNAKVRSSGSSSQSNDEQFNRSGDLFEDYEEEVPTPLRKRVAVAKTKKTPTKRVLSSPKAVSTKRGRVVKPRVVVESSDDDEDDMVVDSPPSEDLEKENKSRRANRAAARSTKVKKVISSPKSKSPLQLKAKKRSQKNAVVKKVIQDSTPEELARAAGIENPTPAMLELFAKRCAKAKK